MKLPEVEVQCADFDHVFLGDLVGKICGRHVLNKPRLPLGLSRENFTFHGPNEYEIQSELRHSTSTYLGSHGDSLSKRPCDAQLSHCTPDLGRDLLQ